ncbi:MAG: hypothetical protein JNM71_13990 [Flavobacterium lindanitolerans]|uniref:hypothetical protein n=1 Tax=Flavobacterium lindanitolerans TaxID=428988 RepID=UPI001A3C67D5|nr:hypothetical protein [Flavobacterium lindanitolerans]MBL7869123.1 hypothetical protein [Flavobacterium lindanitolerans]
MENGLPNTSIEPGSLLDLRLNKGILPTLDIAGHTFYVDLRMNKLRPKDDFISKGIDFTEIKDYYDRDRRAFVIPYNPTKREFQQDDVSKMTELPTDIIIVQFPNQYELDIVGWNRKHNNSIASNDLKQMHFEARTLPWVDTNVIEHIKRNVAEQLQPKEEYIVNEPKDNLYKIPPDTQRVLPTYKIFGTEFIVDVNQLELREKANPKNVISISDMEEKAVQGYRFWYSPNSKSLTTFSEQGAKLAEIPDFVKLDPTGMAKKHNISEDIMAGMDDFKLMVNQEAFDKIAYQGIIPTIDIAGHTFHIDSFNDKLHPTDDIWSRGIIFSELKHYYSHKDDTYTIPYNQRTHTFQEVSLNVMEIPKDLIVVQIPGKRTLDPIGKNKSGNLNTSDYLKKNGVHLHFEAKVIPWHQTRFAETVKRNNGQELKAEQKPTISPKPEEESTVNKRKGRRM